MLDLADGGHTHVEFVPITLWVPDKSTHSLSVRQVADSFTVGVYRYAARARVEGLTLPSPAAVMTAIEVVLFCYHELLAGRLVTAQVLSLPAPTSCPTAWFSKPSTLPLDSLGNAVDQRMSRQVTTSLGETL